MGTNNYELLFAIEKNDIAKAGSLLASGANPNIHEVIGRYSALHEAIKTGNPELVNLLIESGADVQDTLNDVCITPLASAALMGHKHTAR